MSEHLFIEDKHVVMAFPPAASPAGTEDYVSLKGAKYVTVILQLDNATTVTGTTVTLKQATDVAATGEKALAFSTVYVNADTAASDAFTKTAVTSSTFDTATTDNKNLLYVICVDASTLDTANDFDCFRVDVTGGANSVAAGIYVLSGQRYAVGGTPVVSAITD